jgi:hypothetical protein
MKMRELFQLNVRVGEGSDDRTYMTWKRNALGRKEMAVPPQM